MYIRKIDDLFDSNKFNKHFCYKNQKISYIDKNNIKKRYNIFINNNQNLINHVKTEIPLSNSNYYFTTYHKSLENTYKYLLYITNNISY